MLLRFLPLISVQRGEALVVIRYVFLVLMVFLPKDSLEKMLETHSSALVMCLSVEGVVFLHTRRLICALTRAPV
jgi:hypothetical protein